MKYLYLIGWLSWASVSAFAGQGGASSAGGGSFVLLKTGEWRLVDTLHDSVQTQDLVPARQALDQLIQRRPRVKYLIETRLIEPMSCAYEGLQAIREPRVREAIRRFRETKIFGANFELLVVGKAQIQDQMIEMVGDVSERFPANLQIVAGAFHRGQLLIYYPLWRVISDQEKCRLQRHEFFRVLNYTMFPGFGMSTAVIESLVRASDQNDRPAQVPAILSAHQKVWDELVETQKNALVELNAAWKESILEAIEVFGPATVSSRLWSPGFGKDSVDLRERQANVLPAIREAIEQDRLKSLELIRFANSYLAWYRVHRELDDGNMRIDPVAFGSSGAVSAIILKFWGQMKPEKKGYSLSDLRFR